MKQKKRKRMLKRFLSLLAVVCMLFAGSISVFATENTASTSTAVAEAKQGVLQIELVYVDKSGHEYILQTGSGFLVGPSSGAKTVITNYHVIAIDAADIPALSEMFGVDFSNTKNLDLQIKVIVQGDVPITAAYVNGSEAADFAILDLEQTIYNRTTLKLADSDALVDAQTVYALGFPGATTNAGSSTVYSSSDVTVTSGVVGKVMAISGYDYVLHDANLGAGNSGGPLVDAQGSVVGINTMYNGDDSSNYYYSIAINDAKEILDALGITYETANGTASAGNENESGTEGNQTADPNEDGNEVKTDTETTGELSSAEEEKPAAQTVVEPGNEKEDSNMLYIIIAVVAAAVVVVIVVVVVVNKNKKKNMPPPMNGAGGHASANRAMPTPPTPPVSSEPLKPTPPPYMGTMPVDSGAGETSVLGGGAGETSVLSGNAQPPATLIRKKNGESAKIAKQVFVIGKERAKVDFCIPDNNSISRKHANISCRGGAYYIVDNNSTNYTYVNGNKLNPGQEVKLNSGDKIKFADEEFEFRM